MRVLELPGGKLIDRGLADVGRGVETPASLLVQIGGPRLRQLGFDVPRSDSVAEHRLFQLLMTEDPARGQSRYNALLRQLASFQHAARCVR